jgi:hypothetical protein
MSSPSGDLYATQAQIARLEKMVTNQQIAIVQLTQQKNIFLKNLDESIQEQIESAIAERGSKGSDYVNITKFIAKQISLAMSQLHEAGLKSIQESIPLKTLHDLERRMLIRPTATDDLQSIAQRLSLLENQIQSGGGSGGQNTESSADVKNLTAHIEILEKKLFAEVQKAYSTVHKPGELGTPLAKLQAKVETLQGDIARLQREDVKQSTEAMVVNLSAQLKTQLESSLQERASKSDLEKFRGDLQRIEEFSRDAQTISHLMKTKLDQALGQLTARFSEERWSSLETKTKKIVEDALKDTLRSQKTSLANQEQAVKEVLKKTEETVNRLNTEVRSQYGPEILERTYQELVGKLKKQQTEFQDTVQEQILRQISLMNTEYHSLKNQFRDFTATVKQELSGSSLRDKYKEYEDTLKRYEREMDGWKTDLERAEKIQKTTLDFLNNYKQELGSFLAETENSVKGLKTTVAMNRQEIKDQLDVWLRDRQHQIQENFTKATGEVQKVRDNYLVLQKQVRMELDETKLKEKYKQFQNELELKVKGWMQEKEDYLVNRVVDMSQDLREVKRSVESKEREFTELFSEDKIQSAYKDIETRLKSYQEEWNKRRTEEFLLRYSDFDRELKRMDTIAKNLEEREKSVNLIDQEKKMKDFIDRWETRLNKEKDDIIIGVNNVTNSTLNNVRSVLKTVKGDYNAVVSAINAEKAKFMQYLENLKKSQEEVQSLYTEESLQKFVTDCESRLQISQNAWTRKRTEEFDEKFGFINTQISQLQALTQESRQMEKRLLESVVKQSFGEQTLEKIVNQCELRLKTTQDAWMKRKTDEITDRIIKVEEEKKQMMDIVKDAEKTALKVSANFNQQSIQKITKEIEARVRPLLDEQIAKKMTEINNNEAALKKQFELLQNISSQTYQDVDSLRKSYKEFETKINKQFNQQTLANISHHLEQNMKGIVESTSTSLKKTFEEWKDSTQDELKDIKLKGYDLNAKLATSIEKYTNFSKEIDKMINVSIQNFMSKDRVAELRKVLCGDILADIKNNLAMYAQIHLKTLEDKIKDTQERIESFETEVQYQIETIKERSVSSTGQIIIGERELKYNSLTKCFYTAIFGLGTQPVDSLAPIPNKIAGWDYICFTNLNLPPQKGWHIVKLQLDEINPVLQAKRVKWLSHEYLSEYDVVVWMDGYIAPNPMFSEVLKQWVLEMQEKNIHVLHRPHEVRNCVYEECEAVVANKRDTRENVTKVLTQLKDLRFPKNWGLFDTNILFKFHKDHAVQEISEAVFKQMQETSYRDQLAVPLVYYTNGFKDFQNQTLLRAFEKSGNHVRIAAS